MKRRQLHRLGAVKRWSAWRKVLSLWGPVTMVALLPLMTVFLKNRHEVSVQDLVLPFILALLTATIVTVVMMRRFRRTPFDGYVAALLATILLTTNYEHRLGGVYTLLSALLPVDGLGDFEGPLFSLIFIAIILTLALIAGRLLGVLATRSPWKPRDIMGAITLAIVATFLFQFIPTVRTLASAWPQYFYKPPKLAATTIVTPATAKPDIYYIVLDRYASQTVLKDQFGFDNSDFTQFLASNGYYMNADAHQNYPYTTMSISSTLNADYHTDLIKQFDGDGAQTIIPYHRSIQYSSVAQQLKSLGYTYDQIGTWYEATNQGSQADNFYLKDGQLTLFGHTYSLNNFTKNQLQQGMYWRFMNAGAHIGTHTIAAYQAQTQVEMTTYALNTLKDLASKPAGGRFIFAHLLIPHDPYYFNADGSLSTAPNSDNINEPIKQKYVGQVEYINSQLKTLLTQINAQSNNTAVVVLQSDEGPYPMQLNDQVFNQSDVDSEINDLDMRQWSDLNLAMKYGNLAAYHIPQASSAALAEGADNVNVFRVVLNSYFGATLPYLDECYYAYSDGRKHPFVYSDITKRLDALSTATCSANGTGPKS